jgi:hypothetical protein
MNPGERRVRTYLSSLPATTPVTTVGELFDRPRVNARSGPQRERPPDAGFACVHVNADVRYCCLDGQRPTGARDPAGGGMWSGGWAATMSRGFRDEVDI